MRVIGALSIEERTIMKDFYFDNDANEELIQKTVDEWAESKIKTWFVICKEENDNE